jgi:hypothetical protein
MNFNGMDPGVTALAVAVIAVVAVAPHGNRGTSLSIGPCERTFSNEEGAYSIPSGSHPCSRLTGWKEWTTKLPHRLRRPQASAFDLGQARLRVGYRGHDPDSTASGY